MWFLLHTNPLGGSCATGGCLNTPSWRLEAGGVGSNYCHNCKAKIEKPAQDFLHAFKRDYEKAITTKETKE